MNKMTRRIMVSVLTLVLTVVALGTTTFAWFTLSNVASVSNIEADVVAGEGLQIRLTVDGKSTQFKSNINFGDEELLPAGFKFTAVEYDNGFKKLSVTNGKLLRGTDATKDVDYLEVKVEFRTAKENPQINMTNVNFSGITNTFKTKTSFTGIDGATVEVNDTVTVAGWNALRLRIENRTYSNGHTVDFAHGNQSYLTNTNTVIYESNGTDPASWQNTIGTKAETIGNIASMSLDLDGYYYGGVTFQIWLDGWDPHAFDAIFKQALSIAFSFELA